MGMILRRHRLKPVEPPKEPVVTEAAKPVKKTRKPKSKVDEEQIESVPEEQPEE